MLQSMLRSLIEGKFFPAGVSDTGIPQFDQWRHTQSWRCNLRNMFNLRRDLQVLVNKLPEDERAEYNYHGTASPSKPLAVASDAVSTRRHTPV